jgi:TRAP-type mannitol/chloroaromatic compound transport system permease small subunit
MHFHTRLTDALEWVNVRVGEYVAYWALISVFAYYYEVIARFVFNSPTNWVHESMFLMYGMQYMLCGAYAYREDQHVRVDVFYTKFSPRGKAIADIVTSVFFFIFILTMTWTGARFAMDAVNNNEVSFTEWGIQYWPVKLALPIGAALMAVQGLSKLIKDIVFVTGRRA